jgi:HrpA-like RNA helicase
MKNSGLATKADIFQLHASMPTEDQEFIFRKSKKIKIIASTNVAEVRYLADCRHLR